jgi:hypothetical protein
MSSLFSLRKKITSVSFSLFVLGLLAFGPAAAVVSQGQQVSNYTQLVNALRTSGATVTQVEQVQLPNSSANAQIIQVNGSDIQVIEFPNQADRQQVSNAIAQAGAVIDVPLLPYVTTQGDVWASGDLIVLYAGQDQSVMNLMNGVLGQPMTELQPTAIQVPASVVQQVQSFLSQQLSVAAQQVQVLGAQQVNWPNACLGLNQAGQSCPKVVTPGYLVTVKVQGNEYEIRTNQTLTTIRWYEIGSGNTSQSQASPQSLGVATIAER